MLIVRLGTSLDADEGEPAPDGFAHAFREWFAAIGSQLDVFVAENAHGVIGMLWLERVERVPRSAHAQRARRIRARVVSRASVMEFLAT